MISFIAFYLLYLFRGKEEKAENGGTKLTLLNPQSRIFASPLKLRIVEMHFNYFFSPHLSPSAKTVIGPDF